MHHQHHPYAFTFAPSAPHAPRADALSEINEIEKSADKEGAVRFDIAE
jgi:hypothetical protein